MINYTERLALLIDDVVARVPALGYIDTKRLLVFARYGRSDADGADATGHCLTLPTSEPGYYFWRDRRTGRITRRSAGGMPARRRPITLTLRTVAGAPSTSM